MTLDPMRILHNLLRYGEIDCIGMDFRQSGDLEENIEIE